MSQAIDQILTERQRTHGDFRLNAKVSQGIKQAIHWGPTELSDEQKEALDMIALKISRICTGDANHPDHWDDIAGYAKLGRPTP